MATINSNTYWDYVDKKRVTGAHSPSPQAHAGAKVRYAMGEITNGGGTTALAGTADTHGSVLANWGATGTIIQMFDLPIGIRFFDLKWSSIGLAKASGSAAVPIEVGLGRSPDNGGIGAGTDATVYNSDALVSTASLSSPFTDGVHVPATGNITFKSVANAGTEWNENTRAEFMDKTRLTSSMSNFSGDVVTVYAKIGSPGLVGTGAGAGTLMIGCLYTID